jgi:hypothetical protein
VSKLLSALLVGANKLLKSKRRFSFHFTGLFALPTRVSDKSKLRNELIVNQLINLLISSLFSHAKLRLFSGHAAELGGSLGKLVSDETSSGSGSSSETSSPLDSPRHSPSLSIVSTPSPRKAGIYDSDETDALNFTDFSKPMNGKLSIPR